MDAVPSIKLTVAKSPVSANLLGARASARATERRTESRAQSRGTAAALSIFAPRDGGARARLSCAANLDTT